jgi:hypothetical protein
VSQGVRHVARLAVGHLESFVTGHLTRVGLLEVAFIVSVWSIGHKYIFIYTLFMYPGICWKLEAYVIVLL